MTGTMNESPGAAMRGVVASTVTERAMATLAAALPTAVGLAATAISRPLPLYSGRARVTSALPSASVCTAARTMLSSSSLRVTGEASLFSILSSPPASRATGGLALKGISSS